MDLRTIRRTHEIDTSLDELLGRLDWCPPPMIHKSGSLVRSDSFIVCIV